MATLASAIQTRLAELLASPTIVDLSRQRDGDNTVSEDTAKTQAYAESAAVMVKAKLGNSVDSTDDFAVETGAILAVMLSSAVYSITLTDAGVAMLKSVKADLDQEARARRQGYAVFKKSTHKSPVAEDLTDLDKRYPEKTWNEE